MKEPTMACIEKDVVIIGNGPSGISLSVMLAGNVPYLKTTDHPDEMLAARLNSVYFDKSLAKQPLEEVALGLEGRSTNPVSLLLDALEHPYADLGFDLPSLVEWNYCPDQEIDHVVIGKGPPGGSWHTMDPNILSLSLGSWMSLPGYPYQQSDCFDSQRRATAGSIAKYYENYVHKMNLSKYFANNLVVLKVEQILKDNNNISNENSKKSEVMKAVEINSSRRKCSIINALNYLRVRTKCHKKVKETCVFRNCKKFKEKRHDLSPNRMEISGMIEHNLKNDEKTYLLNNNFSNQVQNCDFKTNCDNISSFNDNLNNQSDFSDLETKCCFSLSKQEFCDCQPQCNNPSESTNKNKWLIHTYNPKSNEFLTFCSNYLVLANGASDLPNRLGLSAESYNFSWVLHDLRSLETQLDNLMEINGKKDPVLVVGAGLSAADAVIATRFRNIPVLHVFRNKSVSLDKQLPENMYPEYHKVHQMMLDGGSTYPLYTSLPEYELTDISEDHKVTLTSKNGTSQQYSVSFVVILIGSRPDLGFLPQNMSTTSTLGVNRNLQIDSKTNPININKLTHLVNGFDNLYALGPITGDHFVRFIPGGALAITSDLYKKKNL